MYNVECMLFHPSNCLISNFGKSEYWNFNFVFITTFRFVDIVSSIYFLQEM